MVETIEAVLAAVGVKLKLLLAGSVGAFISLRFFDGRERGERWAMFIAGLGLSTYTAEAAVSLVEVPAMAYDSVLVCFGVLIALFGMSVCGKAIEMIRAATLSGLVQFVLAFFGRRPPGDR